MLGFSVLKSLKNGQTYSSKLTQKKILELAKNTSGTVQDSECEAEFKFFPREQVENASDLNQLDRRVVPFPVQFFQQTRSNGSTAQAERSSDIYVIVGRHIFS